MSDLLLDTSILVDYFKYDKKAARKRPVQLVRSIAARELIIKAVSNRDGLFISAITIKELLQYPRLSTQEEARIKEVLPRVCQVLPITYAVAVLAGEMSRQSAEYREAHVSDCLIAATAAFHRLPLYTMNPRDFAYACRPDLQIIVPY